MYKVAEGELVMQAKLEKAIAAGRGSALSVIERMPTRAEPRHPAERARDAADALEQRDASAAIEAYRQAIAADPARLDARTNLGRLLHEGGRLVDAEQVYRDALKHCGNDALLLYNFGVLLDDMDRKVEAMAAYQLALRGDPAMADCHYNLALLYEELERPKDAIRHMSQYRRLIASAPK